MNIDEILRAHFLDSAALKMQMAESLLPALSRAATLLVAALKNGNKVLRA